MSITINPKWQLEVPGDFSVTRDGKVDYGGDLGLVAVPKDYIEFMQSSDGAVLRDRDGWFVAQFPAGSVVAEVDSIFEMENAVFASKTVNKTFAGASGPALPPTYISIGDCELERMDVLICVQDGSNDYGKVYVWHNTTDPWMEGNNTKGLGYVADSFTDFMNNLTARENL